MDAYALSLKFQTEGFDDVFKKLDQVDQKGQRTAQTGERTGASIERIGHKAAGVAIALSGMSEVGVSAMEKVAHGATNVAFMFGTAGPIVGAVAIAGVAIFNIFQQARKEMEATDLKARELLRGLSLDTGVKTLSALYGGDPFAKTGSPEQLGIAAALVRKAALQHKIDTTQVTGGAALKVFDELNALTDWLKEAEPLYARVTARTKELAAAEVERNTNLIKIGAAQDALNKPAKDEAALTARIQNLTKGLIFDDFRARITKELVALEAQLTRATNDGTASLDARSRAAQHLADVQGALAQKFGGRAAATSAGQLVGITGTGTTPGGDFSSAYGGPMANVKAGATNLIDSANNAMKERVQQMLTFADTLAQELREGLARTLGDAVYNGFATAFSGKGLGAVFKSMGKTVLAGLGGLFRQMGETYLLYGATMLKFTAWLFNPPTSAWAALGIGAALIALSAALGAVGSGGGAAGSGGGYSSGLGYNNTQDQITRIRLMPGWAGQGSDVTARNAVNVYATIIGKNDPQAQRDIKELINNAERRGL